ncbi:MAG TPA: hypothetical protein VGI45_28350 [Terracidiphilus sp.]|jgi:hypothetical protein
MKHSGLAKIAFYLLISTGASPRQAGVEPVARRPVTVSQLAEILEKAKALSDDDAAKEVEHVELTERLSSPELARLTGELSGAKSKAALMAVGDTSVFLDPPPSEMLAKAAPNADEQRQIVSRASDYLKKIIPRLPDFYAKRITTAFRVAWTPKDRLGSHEPGVLGLRGKFQARVLYRNGKEVVRAEGTEELNLITRGTFGPILSIVIKDNLRSPMQWHGWQAGPNGAMAVLQFQVPQQESHYQVSFGGLPFGGAGILVSGRPTGYRGEIGIDPDTGTILRLVLRSDPVLGFRFSGHADLMLEYGSVAIGGKTYTCPVRGVSRSTARYQQMGIIRRENAFILLDDVVFTDYHVFRSEMRIVPN